MEHNGFEYVDLGLSVYWATMNIGANDIYDGGLFFPFGGVTGYTKNDATNGIWRFNKIVDQFNDPTSLYMGKGWRMPTRDEMRELINNVEVTLNNGCAVLKSIVNDAELFVPLSGSIHDNKYSENKKRGFMWTSISGNSIFATAMSCSIKGADMGGYYKERGLPIRAVLPKKQN